VVLSMAAAPARAQPPSPLGGSRGEAHDPTSVDGRRPTRPQLEERDDASAFHIPYAPGGPVPEGFRISRGFDSGLFAAGVAIFGFSYAMSVVLAVSDVSLVETDREDEPTGRNRALYAPLIGPWVALGTMDRPGGEVALLIADGVVQAAGLSLVAVGLGTERLWLVRASAGAVSVTARF
jgi:hypothetical protein